MSNLTIFSAAYVLLQKKVFWIADIWIPCSKLTLYSVFTRESLRIGMWSLHDLPPTHFSSLLYHLSLTQMSLSSSNECLVASSECTMLLLFTFCVLCIVCSAWHVSFHSILFSTYSSDFSSSVTSTKIYLATLSLERIWFSILTFFYSTLHFIVAVNALELAFTSMVSTNCGLKTLWNSYVCTECVSTLLKIFKIEYLFT